MPSPRDATDVDEPAADGEFVALASVPAKNKIVTDREDQ
jgi:hypothetical protein